MGSSTKYNHKSRTQGRGRKAGRGKGLKGGRGNSGYKHNRFSYWKLDLKKRKTKIREFISFQDLVSVLKDNEEMMEENLFDLNQTSEKNLKLIGRYFEEESLKGLKFVVNRISKRLEKRIRDNKFYSLEIKSK